MQWLRATPTSSLSFHGSGIRVWLSWVLWLGCHKSSLQARLHCAWKFKSLQAIGLRLSSPCRLWSKDCLRSSPQNRGSRLGFEILTACCNRETRNKNNPNIHRTMDPYLHVRLHGGISYHREDERAQGRPAAGRPPRQKIVQRQRGAEDHHRSTVLRDPKPG